MGKKYWLKLPKIHAHAYSTLDTPFAHAAVKLVVAVDELNPTPPNAVDLDILAKGFLGVFGSTDPVKDLGHLLGWIGPPCRPGGKGFTSADIVSAVIEQKHREIKGQKGAKTASKKHAAQAFPQISEGDPMRQVAKYWEAGRKTVEGLSNENIEDLLYFYEKK